MPLKVRQLIQQLESAGFKQVTGGKGSHRKFVHPNVQKPVVLSGKSGHDALAYQRNAVKRALKEVNQ